MAQDRYVTDLDGQELGADDLDVISRAAASADDRVLQEFLRLAPYNSSLALGAAGSATSGVQRCVVPFGYPDGTRSAGTSYGLVQAIGLGALRVMPFRAIVGTRVPIAADVAGSYPPQRPRLDCYSDIRSAVCAFSDDNATFGTVVTPSVGTINPRFDVIYCEFTIDVPQAEVGATGDTREVKPPGGGFGPSTVSPLRSQSPVVGPATGVIKIAEGTPAVSPTIPSVPADSGSTYRIPLAVVFIPSLWTGTALTNNSFQIIAPVVPMSERATGAIITRPATINTRLNTSAINAWSSSGNRPKFAMPTSFHGGRKLVVALDLTDTGTFADAAVIDDSIDWRFRYFTWFLLHVTNGSPTRFFFSHSAAAGVGGDQSIPNGLPINQGTPVAAFNIWGVGQSGVQDDTSYANPAAPNRNSSLIVNLDNATLPAWFSTTKRVGIYVDQSTGALKLLLQGSVATLGLFIEINASGQYDHPF